MATQDHAEQLRTQVDRRLNERIAQFYREVPYATHQKDSDTIDGEYLKRHYIEIILRIRNKRMIDALVTHYFTKHDPRQAKAWAQYMEEEMLHGAMFGKDLERMFNMSMEEILAYEPTLSTKLLNGYFHYTLEHEGPMAALASAYFLEYTTRETQPVWLDNLERVLGVENLRGARAHVAYDVNEDHLGFVWNVLMSTVKTPEDGQRLLKHFDNLYGLFAGYFHEVYQMTVGARTRAPQVEIPVAIVAYADQATLRAAA